MQRIKLHSFFKQLPSTYNLLSKTFLISACIFGLVIGMVVQAVSDHGFSPSMNVGAGETGLRTLRGESHWTGLVRLETGEIIPLPSIFLSAFDETVTGYANGAYSGGYEDIYINGLINGAFDNANHFKFTLNYTYQSAGVLYPRRDEARIVFNGQTMGDKAADTVKFIDEYDHLFNGTFAFARYGLNVTAPTPDDPGGSGSSAINGAWQTKKYEIDGGPGIQLPLNLNLKQESTNIVGTAIFQGKTVGVKGNVAGSSFNLMIGDAIPQLQISGLVTQDRMTGQTSLYTGEISSDGYQKPSSVGKIWFGR